MPRAGQTPHGARPNREEACGSVLSEPGRGHVPARCVKPPGRSLEPRSDARPRGMAVQPRSNPGRTEFGLQVRLPTVLQSRRTDCSSFSSLSLKFPFARHAFTNLRSCQQRESTIRVPGQSQATVPGFIQSKRRTSQFKEGTNSRNHVIPASDAKTVLRLR